MNQSIKTPPKPPSVASDPDLLGTGVWQGGETKKALQKRWLDAKTLQQFSGPDTWDWLLGVAVEWAIIVGCFVTCNLFPHPLVWMVGIFIIGSRQHALGILAHEGTHYLVSKSRFWNDLLANLLAAYPLTYPVQGYRSNHLNHHRWLETSQDPEQITINRFPDQWTFPMARQKGFGLLLKDAFGIHMGLGFALSDYIWVLPGSVWPQVVAVASYHLVIIAIALKTGYLLSYLLLWILPLLTVGLMCFRIRTAAEHSGIAGHSDRYNLDTVNVLATTRTTVYGLVSKFLFAPHNMAYHIEHHMFPGVPVFKLKALHEQLMKNPDFASCAYVSTGVDALVGDLTMTEAS